MDLDNVLKLQENQFPIETDSDLNSKFLPYFKIEEDWPIPQHLNIQLSISDIVEDLQRSFDITDVPIEDLVSQIQQKYLQYPHQSEEIYRTLKKTKTILKRERAKNRKNYLNPSRFNPSQQTIKQSECNMGISEEENKRKKNRISAQISRDRKKQYFNSLISENQKLKNQNFLLEKENFELKDILDGRIYDNIKAIIEKSEINTLMSLLQEVQKQKSPKKSKRNTRYRNLLNKILQDVQIQNRYLNI